MISVRHQHSHRSSFLALCLACAGVHAQVPGPETDAGNALTITNSVTEPVGVMAPPGDPSRFYILGKRGTVSVVRVIPAHDGLPTVYQLDPTPYLDLTDRVYWPGNRGLLGLAFAPDYDTSGHVYVFYTTQERGTDEGMIVRYTRSATNPDVVDPGSRQLVFVAPIGPYHHGGTIRFGPDNLLYFAKGDEGNVGLLQARNPGVLYGKMIRIDPARDDFPLDDTKNYGIPQDNPFAHIGGGLPEVWAVGLRSPWQFSFDTVTDTWWLADVGENTWEEINAYSSSRVNVDFGWPAYEGYANGPFGNFGVNPALISFPVYAYPHDPRAGYDPAQVGCSVTGGFVYRGNSIPAWRGRYFFSDFCSGRIFSAVRDGNGYLTDLRDMSASLLTPTAAGTPPAFEGVTAFGVDAGQELYVCEYGGRVRKLVPQTNASAADIAHAGGLEGRDGLLDNNDVVLYINWYVTGDLRADYGSMGGVPGADGMLDNNDLVVYFDIFFNG